MSRNLSDISYEIVERNQELSPPSRQAPDMQNTIDNLLVALHDAINSPKGVVPKTADDFYSHRYYVEHYTDN